ncbi:MAG: hypothetical protein IPM29_15810 [Planctomycetes bacterium]|nr:hypothetical protein [Planctomycetota bacterium]
MTRARAFGAGVALGALASATPAQQTAAPLRLAGEHVALVAHGFDAAVAAGALEVVDAVPPLIAAELGVTAAPRSAPKPEIHLYRTAEAFVAADRARTGGRFARNLACALWDGTAHVALQPEVGDAYLAQLGLPAATLRLLAHETAHVARFALCPGHRAHPRWLLDGLAFTISHRRLRALGRSAAMPDEPVFATGLATARRLATEDRLATVAELLGRATTDADDATPGRRFHELYAQHLAFACFLQQLDAGRPWTALCATLARLPADATPADADAALAACVPAAGLDAAWSTFAAALAPSWVEDHRSLATAADDPASLVQTAFADTDAIAWWTAPCPRGGALRTAVAFLPGATGQADLLLGRDDTGFVQVALVRGIGATVRRHHTDGDRWELLAEHPRPALGRAASAEIELRWSAAGHVTLTLDGDVALDRDLGCELAGAAGLGCPAGTAVRWQSPALRPAGR